MSVGNEGSLLRPRSMQAVSRFPVTDEERGKRDDDFKPKIHHRPSTWLPWKWRKRRIFLGLALIFLIYEFVVHIPTDLGSIDQRLGRPLRPGHIVSASAPPTVGLTPPPKPGGSQEPTGQPPRTDGSVDEKAEKQYYDGKIRFYKLAASLKAIDTTAAGAKASNRNVLFAASSLQSAANLLPMACEMATVDRNYVHFALFGRNTLSSDEVLQLNAVDLDHCKLFFHDARPDYTEYSSDGRAGHAVTGAMAHFDQNLQPQVVIVDDTKVEDPFFTRAMRSYAKQKFRTLIEIPAGKYEEFLWITRLGAGSLASWFIPTVDILVHAPHDNVGSLVRLLRSLQRADFAGIKMPRLSIELSASISPHLGHFLDGFRWPPFSFDDTSPVTQDLLTFHHRLPSARLTSEQASLRFVESFYPTSNANHHVLVLSPQAEVSPLFMQYLHFAILEYRYSSWGFALAQDILGISLDVPSSLADGKGTLSPPTVAEVKGRTVGTDLNTTTLFQYQAPSSSASLIFGDKWALFHDFLSKRLEVSHTGMSSQMPKLVSESEPAWMEYLLELVRARGFSMLHPASPFVTMHNELKEIPEEHLRPEASTRYAQTPKGTIEDASFVLGSENPALPDPLATEPDSSHLAPLHQHLPFNGHLPALQDMPYLSHAGLVLSPIEVFDGRIEYEQFFRAALGGCDSETAKLTRLVTADSTDDLFCFPGVAMKLLQDPGPVAAQPIAIANTEAHVLPAAPPPAMGNIESGAGAVIAAIAKGPDNGGLK